MVSNGEVKRHHANVLVVGVVAAFNGGRVLCPLPGKLSHLIPGTMGHSPKQSAVNFAGLVVAVQKVAAQRALGQEQSVFSVIV
jgi:hypothetical protein